MSASTKKTVTFRPNEWRRLKTTTVSRELGHGSETLVKRIYGHLGTLRHRSKVVEYRVALRKKVLKDQLSALHLRVGER
jgi:hypothetical protein